MLKRIFQKLDDWAERRTEDPHIMLKVFVIGLGARLLLVLLHPQINLLADMLGYHEAAVSLLDYGEFRVKGRLSASRPPLYSIYMFILYFIYGEPNLLIIRISHCILDAFTILLTFKLTEKVFNRKAAVWASFLYALYPANIGNCDMILSEPLFTLLMISGIYLLLDFPDSKYSGILGAALMLGAATLTRTVLFMFPAFLALYFILFHRRRIAILPKIAVLLIVFGFTLVPWLARNDRVFGKPMLTTKSGVDLFLYNHNPFINILFNYSLEGKDVFKDITPWKLSELERDELCRGMAITWIKEHPWLFLFKGIRMQWNIFSVDREYVWFLIAGYWSEIPKWQLALAFFVFLPWIYIFLPLFIWGVVYSWRRIPRLENLILPIIYFLGITFVYYGWARYRAPLHPIMMAFAGYALTAHSEILNDLKWSSLLKNPRTAIAIALLVFFIIGWLLEICIDIGSLFNLGYTHEVWKDFGI